MAQSTTITDLRDEFIAWVNSITSRPVVLANSGQGPKSRVSYGEIFISAYDAPTTQVITYSEDGETETVSSLDLLTIQINLYGDNPLRDASKLQHSLFSADRYLDLWQICGLSGITSIQDLTALETGAMKQRVLLEFRVYATLSDSVSADCIETVDIELDVPDYNFTETLAGGVDPHPMADICFT